jgi:hypothetical protein
MIPYSTQCPLALPEQAGSHWEHMPSPLFAGGPKSRCSNSAGGPELVLFQLWDGGPHPSSSGECRQPRAAPGKMQAGGL